MNKILSGLIVAVISFSTLPSFAAGDTKIVYEDEVQKIQTLIKSSEFKQAEINTKILLEQYPDNLELKAILARLYKWQNKYDESLELYNQVLSKTPDNQDLKVEYNNLLVTKEIDDLKELQNKVGPYQYEERLKEFYKSGKDIYTGGYMLGIYYIKNREFKKAADIFEELHKIYPNDTDFNILYLESLLESKDYKTAKQVYSNIEEEEISFINKNRDDLTYRLDKNYFSLKGGYYLYSAGLPSEKEVSLELSQQLGNFTLVPKVSNISRFGLNDSQIAADFYSTLGEKRWGYISLSASPDAEFLPVWTAGAEVYQGIGIAEFSLGYNRLNFKDLGVNIVKPGVRVYLPGNFAIEEKLNIVPEQQTMLLLSTINYEPNHKFKAFYTIGIGQLAERITSTQDLQKLNTYVHTVGLQYRFMPQISLNTEFLYNYREGLYDIKGASIFTRYWW